ncbi:MAG: hypothetical protein K2X82_16325, partial [Gemmataceae bacterium]|nr:hypothetical protein [Gemmataceae bacterium]
MRRVLSVRVAWCVLAAGACLVPRPAAAGLIVHRTDAEAFVPLTAEPGAATPAVQPAAADLASAPTPFRGVPTPPAGLLAALGGLLVVAAA